MSVQAVTSTPDVAVEPEAPAPTGPTGPGAREPLFRAFLVGAVGLVALWLLLRPSRPQGVAAEIDLLVLPALLFAEVRLVLGLLGHRLRLPPVALAIFFGLGAVLAPLTALVVERAAGALLGESAAYAVGPVVEILATTAPVAAFALLLPAGQRLTVGDATLAGLASGLGFLLVQTTLVTAASHVGPDYVSPLLAGWLAVPAAPGTPTVFFVGSGLATALTGLGVGLGVRYRDRPWRLLPAGLALVLVAFDRGLFDWRLRLLSASEYPDPSGVVGTVQRLTLHGRLALVLLVVGLVLARRAAAVPAAEEAADGEDTAGEDSAGEITAEEITAEEITASEGTVAASADAGDVPVDEEADGAPAGGDDLLRRYGLVVAVAVGAAVLLTWSARARLLDVLQDRSLALVVCLLGLGYASLCLAGVQRDGGGDTEGIRQGRRLLCLAAVASAALGVLWTFLPTPEAEPPLHGVLFGAAALGWAAQVGNFGVVLGLGGLTAPPPPPGPGGGSRWTWLLSRSGRAGGADRMRWEFGSWRGAPAGGRRGRLLWWRTPSTPGTAGGTRTAGSAAGGTTGVTTLAGGRWTRLLRGRRRGTGPVQEGPGSATDYGVAITLEPVYRAPLRAEASGATVKEAIQSALRELGVDLAHASLQLLDAGAPAVPGKGGLGRPARVRVTAARDERELFLLPPARDSITRDTPFTVVVQVPAEDDAEPPSSIEVTLTGVLAHRSSSRTLTCSLEDSPADGARYRSNPYTVDGGEDTTWAEESWWSGATAAGALRVEDGDQVQATYRRERATITVYDSWAHQAVAVNRSLLEITTAHHQRALAELDAVVAELEASGDDAARLRRRAEQLRGRLDHVQQASLLFADPAVQEDEVAFRSTALLHLAMSVEDEDEDRIRGAAQDALRRHRQNRESERSTDSAGAYGELLLRTALGQLWTQGVGSSEQIGRLLGWDGGVGAAGRREVGQPPPLPRGDEGFTLVELLVTIVIMGIAFAVIVGGLGTAIIGADIQKQGAGADIVLRNAAEAIVYKPCAGPADYPPTQQEGFTVTVQSVSYWERDQDSFQTACPPDSGLQLVELRAVSTGSPRPTDKTLRVVKRKP